MRLVYYTAGGTLLSFFAIGMLFAAYALGALFAYVINTIVDLLRNAAYLNAWQGFACLVLGGGIFHCLALKKK